MIDPLKLDLVFTPLSFSQNRIEHFVDAAPFDISDRLSLRYFLQILTPINSQSSEFGLISTAEGRETPPTPPFITSEGARFLINDDTNGLLDGLLQAKKPSPGQSIPSVISTLTLPVKLISNIEGGTPPVDEDPVESKIWTYKGGLSGADFANFGSAFFDKFQQDNRQFLTWQHSEKIIYSSSEEYLYFLSNFLPLPSELRLRVEVTGVDFEETTTTKLSISSLIQNQVYCFPVSPSVLGIPDNALYYTVWISDQFDSRISELRRYHIDQTVYDQSRQIIFRNSFNTFDTIRFTGESSTTLTVKKNAMSADKFGKSSEYDFPDFKIVSVSGSEEFQIRTGYFRHYSSKVMRYLSELLLSGEIYLKTDSGHLPIELVTSELITESDSTEGPLSRTFTFRVLKSSSKFSNLPATTPQQARPTGYQPIGLVYLHLPNGYRSGYIKGSMLKKVYLDTYEDVKPLFIKPNNEGDPDFIPPVFNDEVANTAPFKSAYLEKEGTFIRSACPNPANIPGPATIIILQDAFGGESQEEADKLADITYKVLNTQDYADLYGRCDTGPWTYTATVTVGFARFRTNNPQTGYAANGVSKYNDAANEVKGNGWWCWGEQKSATHVFTPGTWDVELPTTFGPNKPWDFVVYSPASRIRIFVNGSLIYDNSAIIFNSSGVFSVKIPHANIPSQGRVYLQID